MRFLSGLLLVAFAILVMVDIHDENRLQDDITSALALVDGATLNTPAADGVVETLSPRLRYEERVVRQFLGRYRHETGFMVMNLSGQSGVTAMAMGTDHEHHIVNSYLVGYQPFQVGSFWQPLYILSRRKQYQYDKLNYPGYDDIWQNSRQAFFYTRGDCEDHAIVLADWLIGMGEDARVVVGHWRNEAHAWVVLMRDGESYILEATQKSGLKNKHYPLASLEPDYHPQYMFNRQQFWRNQGSNLTTLYSGRQWQEVSHYWAADQRP